ncbi:MAG: FRG domain-containing protein [Spirochaetes bacterium]|nr:FRG domain-containing protein [Spirochaetota bacterium]
MHTIREKIYTHFIENISIEKKNNIPEDMEKVRVNQIRNSSGFKVKTFRTLVRCMAALGYMNPHFNLLYRGQDKDYRNNVGSIIYPSIFRPKSNKRLSKIDIEGRFDRLGIIHKKLRNNNKITFLQKGLLSYPEYYYALVQHYETNPTPLIDLTHSLRVAATFALHEGASGYIFVFGMPHPHGSISHFIDQEMVLVKLQNVCPPNALRPHYQEGYLVGNLPIKEERLDGDNLARRLIGKYYLDNSDGYFWDKEFTEIPKQALFPANDPIQRELEEISNGIKLELY